MGPFRGDKYLALEGQDSNPSAWLVLLAVPLASPPWQMPQHPVSKRAGESGLKIKVVYFKNFNIIKQ